MFSVDFDPGRNPDNGQFFVSIIEPDHDELINGNIEVRHTNRLGYWCDRGHLDSFTSAIEAAIRKSKQSDRVIILNNPDNSPCHYCGEGKQGTAHYCDGLVRK